MQCRWPLLFNRTAVDSKDPNKAAMPEAALPPSRAAAGVHVPDEVRLQGAFPVFTEAAVDSPVTKQATVQGCSSGSAANIV